METWVHRWIDTQYGEGMKEREGDKERKGEKERKREI